MKVRIQGALIQILIFILAFFLFSPFLPAEDTPFEVIIKVNEEGFLRANGRPLGNRLEVPKERSIKLIFEHVGKPEVEHAFVLLFDSDEEIESGTISGLNRRTHIRFNTGSTGETYDVFCVIVDCDGMEHLIDLVIVTV
jgi:hypothetical protein